MRSGALLLLAVLSAAAQPQEALPHVRTTGEATVKVRPDRARVEIGVVTQASTADAAAAENARKLDAVLRELRSLKLPGAEIRTISYTVNPQYRYPPKPDISGYSATNVVEVVTDDISAVGKVIDTAVRTGANNIRQVQFTIKDPQAARTQALAEAATKARASANALASALGLRIVRVLSVQEQAGEGPIRPMDVMMAREAQAPPTPVESGMIEIRASVTLTVQVAQ